MHDWIFAGPRTSLSHSFPGNAETRGRIANIYLRQIFKSKPQIFEGAPTPGLLFPPMYPNVAAEYTAIFKKKFVKVLMHVTYKAWNVLYSNVNMVSIEENIPGKIHITRSA